MRLLGRLPCRNAPREDDEDRLGEIRGKMRIASLPKCRGIDQVHLCLGGGGRGSAGNCGGTVLKFKGIGHGVLMLPKYGRTRRNRTKNRRTSRRTPKISAKTGR